MRLGEYGYVDNEYEGAPVSLDTNQNWDSILGSDSWVDSGDGYTYWNQDTGEIFDIETGYIFNDISDLESYWDTGSFGFNVTQPTTPTDTGSSSWISDTWGAVTDAGSWAWDTVSAGFNTAISAVGGLTSFALGTTSDVIKALAPLAPLGAEVFKAWSAQQQMEFQQEMQMKMLELQQQNQQSGNNATTQQAINLLSQKLAQMQSVIASGVSSSGSPIVYQQPQSDIAKYAIPVGIGAAVLAAIILLKRK